MAKTKRSWIQLNYTNPDALRAQDIPYDASISVYDAINNMNMPGNTGAQGQTGLTGNTGAFGGPPGPGGPQGVTGAQGLTGLQGQTGMGFTGLQGPTGYQGQTGPVGNTGAQGQTGLQGVTGLRGLTGAGVQGQTGVPGVTGLRGLTGPQGQIGNTGAQGNTGVSGDPIVYNTVSRYEVTSVSGYEVSVVSSSAVYHGLSWSRSLTALTINRSAHGHSAGDRVIIRNTNFDYQVLLIDSTTLNSFNVTTSNAFATSGSFGAYSLGFTFAHDSFPSSSGTLTAPVGDHADCQLISMVLRTGVRVGTVYDLIVPASAINGAGENTSLSNCYIPDFNVRNDADSLSVVGATMVTGTAGTGSYSTFRFGALGTGSLSRIIVLHF